MIQYVDRICKNCNKHYKKRANQLHLENILQTFCSQKCFGLFTQARVSEPCGNCGKTITKCISAKKRSKSDHIFCSSSCSASYNNKIRVKTRRSKCEILLYELLCDKFPLLTILPNDKTMLNGYEVDIAIPDLKLAIEWNGTVHFKPIYGIDTLTKIQSRDKLKLEIANNHNINLIVIPDLVSTSKYVHKCFDDVSLIIIKLLNAEDKGIEPSPVFKAGLV